MNDSDRHETWYHVHNSDFIVCLWFFYFSDFIVELFFIVQSLKLVQ